MLRPRIYCTKIKYFDRLWHCHSLSRDTCVTKQVQVGNLCGVKEKKTWNWERSVSVLVSWSLGLLVLVFLGWILERYLLARLVFGGDSTKS
jgi:hypothetical protein